MIARLFEVVNLACWAYAIGDGRDRPTPVGAVIEVEQLENGEVLARVVEIAVPGPAHAVRLLAVANRLDAEWTYFDRHGDVDRSMLYASFSGSFGGIVERAMANGGRIKPAELERAAGLVAAFVTAREDVVWVSVGGGARGTGRVGLENAAASSTAEPVVASP